MRTAFLLLLLLGACSADHEPEYTCWTSTDQSRCSSKEEGWSCTHGVVPDKCRAANMGYMEGYDWIVCCPKGVMP